MTVSNFPRALAALGSRRLLRSSVPSGPPPLVLVAHGSRDPRALVTVRALQERVREQRPGLDVRLGHIELNAPLLPDTLAAFDTPGTPGTPDIPGASDTPGTPTVAEVVLVPLLFSPGYHVKHDIPEMAAHARVHARVAAPLGPHPLLAETLHARLTEAGWPPRMTDAERRVSAVVLAAAGSRDPESAAGTRRTAWLLAERLGVPVVPAYASAASPTVPEALRELAARGRNRIAVASCFTAPGRFATQCADAAPWITAAPLGDHPAMARLVLHRYDQALAASATSAA